MAGRMTAWLRDIPDVDINVPPGSEQILDVVGILKWAASAALLVAFFGGLAVWAGGRLADHHRAGRVGVIMMLAGLGGGLFYVVGPQLIKSFSGG